MLFLGKILIGISLIMFPTTPLTILFKKEKYYVPLFLITSVIFLTGLVLLIITYTPQISY